MSEHQKPKLQMTEEQLKRLAEARVKALEKRRQLADLNKKEKALKEVELINRMKNVGLMKPTEIKQESESESEPEPEPQKIVKKAPKIPQVVKVQRRKVIANSDSDSDSSDDEDEVEVLRHVKQKYKAKYQQKYKNQLNQNALKQNANQYIKKQVNDEVMKLAMQNIFPGY